MVSFWKILVTLPALAAAVPVSVQKIPNSYIIRFDESVADLTGLIANVSSIASVSPFAHYDFGNFKGVAINFADALVPTIKALPFVKYVEQDQRVSINALTTQSNSIYGLARISHRAKGTTSYIYDSTAGAGTYAYIIDTGIYTAHPEFEGRASFGADFTGEGAGDGNGHGTHVSGTTGSKTYGVAKKTNLIAVRVLGSNGSGTNSGVIQGIQWAANDAKNKGRNGKAVANMSLGGSFSSAVNDAVNSASNGGLFFAVAAGNENQDASNDSPASAAGACTVGAIDSNDSRASFSNFGSVLDVFAPGVNILSTWNDGKTNTISGTSMATPHITGLGAYLLALEGPRSASALCSRINSLATKNAIPNPGSGSPNAIGYNGNGA